MKTLLAIMILISGCGQNQGDQSLIRSLTDDEYIGRKHYYGWGAARYNDPSNMHNEVKYDVLHTHDIFVDDVGGNYEGQKDIGPHVNASIIRQNWQSIEDAAGADDMFVQYSSGHGFTSGLAVGVSYDEIRDQILALPVKEAIVFTMACHSGGLVDSFNRKRAEWQGWNANRRNLLVFVSSRTQENSSTGPGHDSDEANGPYGSAGSAFGNALWKALLGYADGYVDGVKDGYLSLEEIMAYTTERTRRLGGHIPQSTGAYDPQLIMNRVPPQEFVRLAENEYARRERM